MYRAARVFLDKKCLQVGSLVVVAVVLVGCALNIPSLKRSSQPRVSLESRHPLVGTPVPATTVYRLEDGAAVRLNEVAAGEVRLINFWATWCPPCKEEMPELQALYTESKLTVVGVDLEEPPDLVEKFVNELGITFPIVIGKQADALSVYKLLGIPTSWLVDADGTIQHVWTGKITRQIVEERLNELEVR